MSETSDTIEIRVPDIGDFKDVPVIEVLVKPGDAVEKNDSLIVLESDKASMEVPAEAAGVVQDVRVKPGDKVSQGDAILTLGAARGESGGPVILSEVSPASGVEGAAAAPAVSGAGPSTTQASPAPLRMTSAAPAPPSTAEAAPAPSADVHASPATRRFARERGIDLGAVRGSGPRGRVTLEDVQNHLKTTPQRGAPSGATAHVASPSSASPPLPPSRPPLPPAAPPLPSSVPPLPKVDFAQYGAIERKPLSRIKRLSGPNLHRNWLQVPHITNYDEADVTDLETFRTEINAEQSKGGGIKLTMLAFLIKASVAALQRFAEFNASLDGEEIVYKRYYNIGFAADTPNGLVVPVVKNAETKGLLDLARETAELAGKARDGKLGLGEMQGGSFTVSSVGGIGGTGFTQIVNAPEVAILGAVRAATKPVWNGSEFVPRTILPISVSYDHRAIDGAGAARFLAYLANLLADFRRLLL